MRNSILLGITSFGKQNKDSAVEKFVTVSIFRAVLVFVFFNYISFLLFRLKKLISKLLSLVSVLS
jgi:hypothetical protein